MEQKERMRLTVLASTVFRPGAPIDKYGLFAGRTEQVKDLVHATIQPGRHVILYGERGVGKTSLAKVLSEILSVAEVKLLDSGTIDCDASDDFSSLWHKIFRELSIVMENRQAGFITDKATSDEVCLESLLPKHARPDDIRFVLNRLPSDPFKTIIIIDELDRIQDKKTTTLLADTIKNLSDHTTHVTLILVGVASAVEDLISEHKSIERALVQVHMPRMSSGELVQIIDKGLTQIGMTMDEPAKLWITQLSQGLPHYTHSLGLYSALKAIDSDKTHISISDVVEATRTIVEKHTLLSTYHKATRSPQKQNIYTEVLLACALTNADELGYFPAASVSKPLSAIKGKRYYVPSFARHLRHFCDPKRGPVLENIGDPRKLRYRFIDPMMQPFVIINGYATGLLTEEMHRKAIQG